MVAATIAVARVGFLCFSNRIHEKSAAKHLLFTLCITKTPSSGFPSNVTLLLPRRLLNAASSSLPHVADFNGIRHGWDLRDPQVDLRLSRRDCASSRLKRRPGIRSGVPDSRGAAALSRGSELAGLEEAGNQRDLALGFIFRNLCHFLLARRFQELPSIGVSGGPDLREKIAVAVTIEDQF